MTQRLKYIPVKLLLSALLLVIGLNASAQHYVGARIGYGSGTARFYVPQDIRSVWGLYSGGVSWKYFSPEKYVGGVEVDVLLMQQGFSQHGFNWEDGEKRENFMYLPGVDLMDKSDTTLSYRRYVNSVMVPIFWQPHAYLFRRSVRVFINLGVTFSYNINSRYEWHSERDGGKLLEGDYKMIVNRDNRWGYGLCGGGGIGWSAGRVETFAEVRYYIGYSDILKNKNKYDYNPRRTPMDGLQVSVGVFYRLGKGGILSQPSKKVAQKLNEREMRRMSELSPDPEATETTQTQEGDEVITLDLETSEVVIEENKSSGEGDSESIPDEETQTD